MGAAPGGWTQYVADKVGKNGLVVAVDLRELDPLPHKNVKTLQIDISDEEAPKRILEVANGRVDMVLSDLSPSLSGVWEVDVARQVDLSLRALKMAKRILKRSGSMVLKVFEGMDSWRVVEELRKGFSTVKLFKPPASRKRSAEIYAVGLDFK